jgi:hypothetical protein
MYIERPALILQSYDDLQLHYQSLPGRHAIMGDGLSSVFRQKIFSL